VSGVAYIDTTLRDLATYPWGSSIDADALAVAAQALSAVGAAALEAVDPRCARAGIELRTESPWDRLRSVVRHAGPTPVGVVIHGRMLWHDRPVADDVVRRFVMCAVESGARRVRALDPLNDPANLAAAAEACVQAGVEFVPTIVASPTPAPDDARWREEARALAALPGARSICLSDGGGHLGPRAVATLVRAVAEASGLPVEVLVQAPGGLAPILSQAAVEAGAAAVYGATGPVAMTAARPSAETLRAAFAGTARELAVDQEAIYQAARTVGPMLTTDRLSIAASDLFGPAVSLPPDLESALVSRLGRLGMSRNLIEVAEEARAVASEVGAVTFAYPLGDAVVAQAADHVIGGARWEAMEPVLAAAVLGRLGRLRGPVSPEARVAAEAAGGADDAVVPDLAAVAQSAPRGTSDEDLVLLAQFPEATERLVARRRSLRTEVADEEGAQIDRVLLETLIQAVESSADSEVSVELGGARVTVRRSAPAPGAGAAAGAGAGAAAAEDDGMHRITSPMVGTFYRASSPEADPFVSEGQRVKAGQVLCLIEAMKLFNEITADVDGVVRRIPVENANGVEFGDVLFVIETT
jgi:oxaloacetate decarboxylase alpha subunit